MKTTKNCWSKMLLSGMLGIVLTFVFTVSPVFAKDPKPYVYDKDIPAEQLSQIRLSGGAYFSEFDGVKYKWKSRNTPLNIPSGEHTITLDFEIVTEVIGTKINYVRAHDVKITYNFVPGISYQIGGVYNKISGDIKTAITPFGTIDKIVKSTEPTKFEGTWQVPEDKEGDSAYIFKGNTFVVGKNKINGVFVFNDEIIVFFYYEMGGVPMSVSVGVEAPYSIDKSGNLSLTMAGQKFVMKKQ